MSILDQTDDNKDYFSDLVGEGKKYPTPAELAKAYHHADTHIRMLEQSNDEIRAQLLEEKKDSQARATLQDLVRQLQGQGQQSTSNNEPTVKEIEKPIDVNEIDKLVSNRIAALRTAEKEEANANVVVSKLKERFGDNYSGVVKQQIADIGLSEADFDALARKSPELIFRSLGLNETKESFSPPPRNQGFAPRGPTKKTWSYYQEMKKTNPNLYRDPKTTNEMTQAAIDLGDAFYDGDYNRFESQPRGVAR